LGAPGSTFPNCEKSYLLSNVNIRFPTKRLFYFFTILKSLNIVCFGAGEIHTRAHMKFRGDVMRRRSPRVASPRNFARACACVYFARPTIAIAKIRDYSQSINSQSQLLNFQLSDWFTGSRDGAVVRALASHHSGLGSASDLG